MLCVIMISAIWKYKSSIIKFIKHLIMTNKSQTIWKSSSEKYKLNLLLTQYNQVSYIDCKPWVKSQFVLVDCKGHKILIRFHVMACLSKGWQFSEIFKNVLSLINSKSFRVADTFFKLGLINSKRLQKAILYEINKYKPKQCHFFFKIWENPIVNRTGRHWL